MNEETIIYDIEHGISNEEWVGFYDGLKEYDRSDDVCGPNCCCVWGDAEAEQARLEHEEIMRDLNEDRREEFGG